MEFTLLGKDCILQPLQSPHDAKSTRLPACSFVNLQQISLQCVFIPYETSRLFNDEGHVLAFYLFVVHVLSRSETICKSCGLGLHNTLIRPRIGKGVSNLARSCLRMSSAKRKNHSKQNVKVTLHNLYILLF